MKALASVKQATLQAVVYKADGTVKTDLGVIGYYHRSRTRRFIYKVKKLWRQYSRT